MNTSMEMKQPDPADRQREPAAACYPTTGILTPRMAPGALAALCLALFGSRATKGERT